MENPEEVLQALDEFQKMRPTEIPRELEEYLCWVAKTGDPVYQWSLIKALFREKLTRVMTDFYESCPSFDLAPCPNVETFNYDTMKSSLLERLESFANAPFTVQRICELLTAPRKEYNRVDKFMRAIEKNILVVSTKEPGSAVRRNENGDGMVNGTVEDNLPPTSAGEVHEVEMDSWVKDCADSTVGISVDDNFVEENETRLLDDVTTVIPKNGPATNDDFSLLSQEKTEHTPINNCDSSGIITTYIPSTSEFPEQITESRDCMSAGLTAAQNFNNSVVHETQNNIVGDVSEAIMNEDTSSQPSLDIDSPESGIDPNRKLQTTFQAKDFINYDSKSLELDQNNSKLTEIPDEGETDASNEASSLDSDSESPIVTSNLKSDFDERESILPNMESFLQTNSRRSGDSVIISEGGTSDNHRTSKIEANDNLREEDPSSSKSTCTNEELSLGNATCKSPIISTSSADNNLDGKIVLDLNSTCKHNPVDDDNQGKSDANHKSQTEQTKELNEESSDKQDDSNVKLLESELENPIDNLKSMGDEEESYSGKSEPDDCSQDSENSILTIEETNDNDFTESKNTISDLIPVVEEPKESEPLPKDSEKEFLIEEVDSESQISESDDSLPKNESIIISPVENRLIISEELPLRTEESIKMKTTTATTSLSDRNSITEFVNDLLPKKDTATPAESMEVDGEETATMTQDDEPMDQEVSEVSSSS